MLVSKSHSSGVQGHTQSLDNTFQWCLVVDLLPTYNTYLDTTHTVDRLPINVFSIEFISHHFLNVR